MRVLQRNKHARRTVDTHSRSSPCVVPCSIDNQHLYSRSVLIRSHSSARCATVPPTVGLFMCLTVTVKAHKLSGRISVTFSGRYLLGHTHEVPSVLLKKGTEKLEMYFHALNLCL